MYSEHLLPSTGKDCFIYLIFHKSLCEYLYLIPASFFFTITILTTIEQKNSYGRKIYNLQKDVEAGNFAVLGDPSVSNWLDLFISGTNRGYNPAVKATRAKETEIASALKTAIAAGDKAGTQKAYSEFIKVC